MIVSHVTASISAFVRSIQYARVLKITRGLYVRYVKKSVRLSLCYAGFAGSRNPIQAWRAGEAAFLSCAYDVVTDWQHFDKKARAAFENILNELAEPELQHLALSLYDKELHNELADDGLERGSIALYFILGMMRCEKRRSEEWGDLADLGELLQIADDILDYEDDAAAGDQNCLMTASRDIHLRRFVESLNCQRTRQLFGAAPSVLAWAIKHARKKATTFLANSGV